MKYALFLFAIGIWVEFETYPTLKECEEVKEILESKATNMKLVEVVLW